MTHVRVVVLSDAHAWDAIRADWDGLHAAARTASPPVAFDWQSRWWRVYRSTRRDAALCRNCGMRHHSLAKADRPEEAR